MLKRHIFLGMLLLTHLKMVHRNQICSPLLPYLIKKFYDFRPVKAKLLVSQTRNKLGLSCAKLSSSWLQA